MSTKHIGINLFPGAIVSHPDPDGVTIQLALDYINSHPTLLKDITVSAHVEYIQDELDKLKHIQKSKNH